jgi:hypothetical protein
LASTWWSGVMAIDMDNTYQTGRSLDQAAR